MTKAWDESWYRGDGCSVEVFSLSTLHIENILRTADKFAEGGRFNWKYAPLSLLNHSAEQNCSGLVASLLIAGGIQAMVPELGYLDASIYPAESRLPWLDYRLGYFLYVVQFGLDWERRNPAFLIAVGGLLVSVLSGRIVDTHTRLIRKAVLEINYGPLFFVLGSYFSGMLLLQENCRNLGVGVFVGTVLVAYSGYLLYTALDSLARWITGLLSFSQGVVTPSLLRKVLLQAEYAETGYTRTHQALVRGVKGVMVFVWYVLSALESGFLALTNIDADRQTLATVRILLMFFYALRLHYARARMMDEWREDAEKKELLPEDQASYYEFSSLSNNPHFIASAFILFDMVFFIRKDYSPSAAGWLEAFSSFALTKNEQIDLAFMVGSLFVLVGVFRMLEHMSSKHDGHPRFWLVPKPYSRERMDPDLFSAYRVR